MILGLFDLITIACNRRAWSDEIVVKKKRIQLVLADSETTDEEKAKLILELLKQISILRAMIKSSHRTLATDLVGSSGARSRAS